MSNIDLSAVNLETLSDTEGLGGSTSKPGSAKRAGFGKKNQGPGLKAKKGGKGPSAKVSKATKTTGKFGGKSMK